MAKLDKKAAVEKHIADVAKGDYEKPVAEGSRSRAGDKVTVLCKHPSGVIMRLFRMVEHTNIVNGKTYSEAEQTDDTPVRLNGTATPFGMPTGIMIVGGYALTSGVDAGFFHEWMKQNKDHPMVKNNLIKAMPNDNDARALAQEFSATRSGLESLIPDTDPRIPRRVKTADEQKALMNA